jgi:hypothetical protein
MNSGLNQMMINPTVPTMQQVREIRGRDSYTAKLVGATTSLTVPPDFNRTQAGTINQQRKRQLNFQIDNERY